MNKRERSSTSLDFDVRKATLRDLPQIVALHAEVFVPTYTGIAPGMSEITVLHNIEHPLTVQGRTRRFGDAINDPNGEFLVAHQGAVIVGFCQYEINPETKRVSLDALYVANKHRYHDKSRKGEGIGQTLLQKVIDLSRPIDVWVAQKTPALTFYEKEQFEYTGKTVKSSVPMTHPSYPSSTPIPSFRLRHMIRPQQSTIS